MGFFEFQHTNGTTTEPPENYADMENEFVPATVKPGVGDTVYGNYAQPTGGTTDADWEFDDGSGPAGVHTSGVTFNGNVLYYFTGSAPDSGSFTDCIFNGDYIDATASVLVDCVVTDAESVVAEALQRTTVNATNVNMQGIVAGSTLINSTVNGSGTLYIAPDLNYSDGTNVLNIDTILGGQLYYDIGDSIEFRRRFKFENSTKWLHGPNSPNLAPANKVVSGTPNLGTTGNVVIPPEAKVEDGYGFGAAGTEFEGSLPAVALLPVSSVRARVDRGDGEFGTFVGDTPVQEIFPTSGTPATVALTTTLANALTITPSSPIREITLRINADADVDAITLEVLAKQTPNHSGETVVNAANIISQMTIIKGAYPVPASTETIVRIQVPRAYSYIVKAKDDSVTATPSATFDAVV